MTTEPESILDQIKPGAWDAVDAGTYEVLMNLMDEAQGVCAARVEHARTLPETGRLVHERWVGVSRRMSEWRNVIRPDNRKRSTRRATTVSRSSRTTTPCVRCTRPWLRVGLVL